MNSKLTEAAEEAAAAAAAASVGRKYTTLR